MEPLIKKQRQQYPGGQYVDTTDLNQWNNNQNNGNDLFAPMEDTDFDDIASSDFDGDTAFESIDVNPDMTGDDEKRRIESLKRAIEIAKLMSNVTIEGIISIAEEVDKYIRENA